MAKIKSQIRKIIVKFINYLLPFTTKEKKIIGTFKTFNVNVIKFTKNSIWANSSYKN